MFYVKKVALFIVGWLIAINSLNYLGFGAFMQLAVGVVIGLLFTTVIKRDANL